MGMNKLTLLTITGEQDGLCKWQRVNTRYGVCGGKQSKMNTSLQGTGTGPCHFGNILEGLDEEVARLSANQSQAASYSGHNFMAA